MPWFRITPVVDLLREQFDRRRDEHTPRLTRSTCRYCHTLVGASAEPRILKILEDAHQCPHVMPGVKSILQPPKPR